MLFDSFDKGVIGSETGWAMASGADGVTSTPSSIVSPMPVDRIVDFKLFICFVFPMPARVVMASHRGALDYIAGLVLTLEVL